MTTFKATSGLIAVKSDSGLGIFHIHSHRCLTQVRPYGNRELLALSIQKKKKKKRTSSTVTVGIWCYHQLPRFL